MEERIYRFNGLKMALKLLMKQIQKLLLIQQEITHAKLPEMDVQQHFYL